MKNRKSRDGEVQKRGERVDDSGKKKKMSKNMQRLGGAGLSLEAFANAKSTNNGYNPALLKKKREFYKNAKHVNKYKKKLKQQNQHHDPFFSIQPVEKDESRDGGKVNQRSKKKGKESYSLEVLYVKKREEQEKARMEREATINVKKEQQQRAEARRRALREKMFKKTCKGQPVMKYRIEHLLETIQGSS